MKKLLLVVILISSMSAMIMTDAHARRFGGGSFGRQSANVSRMQRTPPAASPAQQKQAAANQQSQQQAANTAKQPGRFGGMLGGALLGLGLGALLAHLGIGGDMAGMISTILMITMIYFAVKMLFRLRSRKAQPSYQQSAGQGVFHDANATSGTPEIGSGLFRTGGSLPGEAAPASSGGEPPLTWDIPADFEVNSFIRNAKAYYIRMQAAWDKADIDDIHEFTTPEMYAEMKLQLQERGPGANVTDVVSLDATLLGIETIGDEYFASVKFSGTVRENREAELTAFTEVWNLTRPVSGKEGWVLAGVQQLS